MKSTNCPAVLWDFAFEYVAEIRAHTAHPLHALKGDVPQTVLLGQQEFQICLNVFNIY